MKTPFDRAVPPPIPEAARRKQTQTSPAQTPLEKKGPPPPPDAALRHRTFAQATAESGPKPFTVGVSEATHASPDHPNRNEDSAFISARRGLAFVADGMGGVPAGELASGIAASILDRAALKHLEERATPEQKPALTLVRRVFEAELETPLTQAAVEKATDQLFRTMNDQIEQVVQKSSEALDRAALYLHKQAPADYPLDPFTKQVDRSRLGPEQQRMVTIAASMIGTTGSLQKIWRDAEGKPFVTVGNMGDSRTYLVRNGELLQLTEDHSPITKLKELGVTDIDNKPLNDDEEAEQRIYKEVLINLAEKHPELRHAAAKSLKLSGKTVALRDIRNIITAALGNGSMNNRVNEIKFTPFIATKALQEGDLLLSATDGLIDNRNRDRIQLIANTYRHQGPAAIAKALADDAYHASLQPKGKKDDIRVVATEIRFAN